MRRVGSDDFPRVQVLPGLGRASLLVDGVERMGYDLGEHAPRPCIYPLIGPGGRQVTRIGHPNPVGHEHHRSIWFGHEKVGGINFWAEGLTGDARVRHRRVTAYEDGMEWGGLAAEIDWWAGGRALLRQTLILAIEPMADEELLVDLQSRFEAPNGPVELGKTNFGFLGVRVAKTMAEQTGGGRLTNAEGAVGEPAIFAKRSKWVDYSGPAAPGVVEGIAYLDHPLNPGHPTHWHVRRDGWMEAAVCLDQARGVAAGHPLELRYRLYVHRGACDPRRTEDAWERFAATPVYELVVGSGQIPTLRRATAT